MSRIYKMTEIVGSSPTSFSDAVQQAVKRASKTLRNIGWFQVVEQRGQIKDGNVSEFQVIIKIGFELDE